LAFVIGNEGTGIRPELLAMCDDLVTIPQAGRVESLNAAVSAGILLYEVARQRRSICEQIKHKQRRG
jgi:tRNA G18 (ribose-2'-O)-methylase SpoU